MATMSLTVDASPIRERVVRFIDFFTDQLDKQNNIDIEAIFMLLPINPKSDSTRRRLERRGTINVNGNTLSVKAPPTDNRDFEGTFIDGLGDLGRIVVTFETEITANTSKSKDNLVIDFIKYDKEKGIFVPVPVPVRVSALIAHPQLGREQDLHKIKVFGHEKVIFYFRDQRKSSLESEVTVSLMPVVAPESDSAGPLNELVSRSLRATSRTALFMAAVRTDDCCTCPKKGGGGGLTCTAIVTHPKANTQFLAGAKGCDTAQTQAMGKCETWAENNDEDKDLCECLTVGPPTRDCSDEDEGEDDDLIDPGNVFS